MKQIRDILIVSVSLLLLVCGVYWIKNVPEIADIWKTVPYLMLGIGCGGLGYGVGNIVNKMVLKGNAALAKQIEIDTRDERNIMIGNMAKAKGYDRMIYIFSALMLVYAFMGVSYTIIIPFVAAYLFVICSAVYYRFKIEKMQ